MKNFFFLPISPVYVEFNHLYILDDALHSLKKHLVPFNLCIHPGCIRYHKKAGGCWRLAEVGWIYI